MGFRVRDLGSMGGRCAATGRRGAALCGGGGAAPSSWSPRPPGIGVGVLEGTKGKGIRSGIGVCAELGRGHEVEQRHLFFQGPGSWG